MALAPAASLAMPGGKLAPLMTAARTSFYVPIMLGGLAASAFTPALPVLLAIAGISLSLGAGIGRKIIADERKRQRTYRQQQAKAAVRRFVDEVAFIMNKQTRDGLRSTQRQLRDDFQARAMQLDRSAGLALDAARRASGLDAERQRARRTGAGGGGPPPRPGADRGAGAGGRAWLRLWSSRSHALLDRAAAATADDGARARLAEARARLHGPLRLAIAGKVKAGKSTLLNALLGEELAPTDAGECTKIVTWYAEGPAPQVMVHPLAGRPR